MQHKFFIKIFAVIIITAGLVLSGFGCKGLSKEQQAATKSVSLEYWTVHDDVDQLQKEIAKYRADRPYMKITVRQLQADELYNRLLEALAEDKAPDIISVHARDLRAFKSKLATMPASYSDTTVRTQKNIVNQVETIVTTQAVSLPTTFQIDKDYLQTVKKDVIIDGKIYGLPISLDTMAIYYNKDLLDRSDIAEPPTTWEGFQDAVRKIVRQNQEKTRIVQAGAALGTGTNVVGVDDIMYILFRQSNVEFINTANRAVFNAKPGNVTESPSFSVMDFYTDFANPTRDTYTWNESMGDSLDSFIRGQTAFFFGYSYHNAQIKARAPQLNYGILPMLQLNPEKPVNVANYWVQAVVGKSAKQNEAWGLINYLTHTGATDEYVTATKRPTALRSLVAKQKEDLDLAPFVGQLLIADNWYRGNDYAGAQQAMRDLSSEWINFPPGLEESRIGQYRQEALNRAVSKINQTLK